MDVPVRREAGPVARPGERGTRDLLGVRVLIRENRRGGESSHRLAMLIGRKEVESASSSSKVVAVQWRDDVLDGQWPQFDLDYALCAAFVACLNQSTVVVAWMRNAPVVCVISQKSQYLHCSVSILSRSSITVFIPSIDKTRSRMVLLQKVFSSRAPLRRLATTPVESTSSVHTEAVISETYNSSLTFSGGRPSTALFPLTTMGR